MVTIKDKNHFLGSFFFCEVSNVHEGASIEDSDVSLSNENEEFLAVQYTGVLSNNIIPN
jgi:hypothetical protein